MGLISTSFAQSVQLKGAVHSIEGDSIPGASVMLIGAVDSLLKTYAITDKNGAFKLVGVKSGDYIAKVSFYGYQPLEYGFSVDQSGDNQQLPIFHLEPKLLDAVVIDEHFQPIQIKGDTLEYDSRAFEVKEHDVVEDLLKQLPGVEVQEDGSIKVQGKDVQQVTVDGEIFFGEDASVATKNLPANAVSKIQVFDKTSEQSEFTGIDDGSETTTINIKLKESHKKGVFGNIALSGGSEIPTNESLRYETKGNVFYFKKDWQISLIGMSNNINQTGFTFSDYRNFMGGAQTMRRGGGDLGGLSLSNGNADDGFLTTHATGINVSYKPSDKTTLSTSFFLNNFDKTYQKSLFRETYYNDSTFFTDEFAVQNSNSINGRGTLFFQQKFDSTQQLNFNLSGELGETAYLNDNLIKNYNSEDGLFSSFTTALNQDDFNYSFNSSADYRKKFLKPGRYTGLDLAYDRDNSDIQTYLSYLNTLVNDGVPVETVTNQDQYTLSTTDNFSGAWTWSEPITKNQLLQADLGYKRSSESRNRSVYDILDDQQSENIVLSGLGDYLQTSYYGELRHKFIANTFNTTIGLNYEHLILSGAAIFASSQPYDYIFPNLRIDWDPNKKSNLRIDYTTSINAPSLNQLQPLQDNTNPSQLILGNTDLTPEYAHRLNLRFRNINQYNFSFFMANITGEYTENNIVYSQNLNEFYVTELSPENIGSEKSLSAFAAYGASVHRLKTKFRIRGNGSVSNGLVNLNQTQDAYTTYSFSPVISIENIGKSIVDLRSGLGYNYSINTYKDNSSFNNDYQNINYYVNMTFKLKDRWEFNPIFQHYFYPDFETNNEIMLLDFNIALNLLESRKLQIFVSGKDLLNQNTGFNQYYLQNIYERELTETLGRYVMLGLKYSFERFGGK